MPIGPEPGSRYPAGGNVQHEAAAAPDDRSRKGDDGRVSAAGLYAARIAPVGTAILLALVAGGLPARAASEPLPKVLLLRPAPTSEALLEATLRIRSELAASGFEVTVADSPSVAPGADLRAQVEQARQDAAAVAAVGVFGDLDEGAAELWVVERISGKPATWHLEVRVTPDRRISEVLAIRVQELLRASQIELGLAAERPAPPPPSLPPPPRPQPDALVKPRVAPPANPPLAAWALAVEAGAAGFGGWGGLGASLAPAARLRLALGERLWLRLSAMGLGTRPTVRTDLPAAASVSQGLLLLECAAWLRPGRRVRPLFSLGLGGERMAVVGSVGPPFHGERNARWFFAGDVGAGVALRLATHLELLVEAHALVAAPRPAVRFFDVEAARAGQPTLLLVLTLAAGT
jgi:hypothetical protein